MESELPQELKERLSLAAAENNNQIKRDTIHNFEEIPTHADNTLESREVRGVIRDPRLGRESKNVEAKDRAEPILSSRVSINLNSDSNKISPSKTQSHLDIAAEGSDSADCERKNKNEAVERRRKKTEERKARER